MADLVSGTINVITVCVNTYTDFCVFKEECEAFRRSLSNVVEVLEDIDRELAKTKAAATTAGGRSLLTSSGGGGGGRMTNTKLRRPMELLRAATNEGGDVLKKCSAKRTLLAVVFSRQLLGMLNKAKADIEEAMRLLQVSSVNLQVSTRRMMDSVSDQLDELHQQIRAGYSTPNAVADLVRAEMKMQRDSHDATVAAAVSEALLKMGMVSSPQDCAEQFAELQREADRIRQAKVIYDEEMLEAVKALTAPKTNETVSSTSGPPRRKSSVRTSAVQECLVCPISGDIMHDPVTVVESGLTYDCKSLCASLLMYPDLEPATGQRFDQPLHYIPNYAVRNLVTAQYGDSAYQKYNDTDFKEQYEAKWEERLQPVPVPPSPIAVKKDHQEISKADDEGVKGSDSWTGFDAWSAVTEPTAATSRESGSRSGHESFDSPVGMIREATSIASAADNGPDDKLPSPPGVAALVEVNIVSTDTDDYDDDEEAAKPTLVTQPSGKTSCCSWRTRRGKMLIAGAALLVVIIVVVGVIVGASKSSRKRSEDAAPASTNINEEFYKRLPSSTVASLQSPYSTQSRAYQWVTQQDQVPERDEGSDQERRLFRMTQRFALATLFYSIRGLENWVQSAESECDWGTVVPQTAACDASTILTFLNASSVGTGGTIPPEIGLLTGLTSLALTSNALTSSIPTELGQLSALAYLDVGENNLASSIPTELGSLASLTVLGLYLNDLTSSIPTQLGQLTSVQALLLDTNALTSTIPTELGMLTDMKYLVLYSNSLRSTIPTELGWLPRLLSLNLFSNKLTGAIPTELGLISTLESLYLFNNSLSSTIPTELGQLRSLENLWLDYNNLFGTFPSDLCYMGPYNGSGTTGISVDCSEVSCTCCGCAT